MADTFQIDIATPEKLVLQQQAESAQIPGKDGYMGILPGHAPLLGELAEGSTLRIMQTGGGEVLAAIHGGFLSVTDEGVTVLAEVAELAADIDATRARSALDRARAEGDDSAVRRAEGRLRAAGSAA